MNAQPREAQKKPSPTRRPKAAHAMRGGSPEANRLAIVVLEVLAGVRTPAEAAAALESSLPRYYQWETQAVEGLVAALEPKRKGKQPSPQRQLQQLQKALEQARRDAARHQTLARLAQRTLGIKPMPAADAKKSRPHRAGRRKRPATVRALKAVAALKERNIRTSGNETAAATIVEDAAAKQNSLQATEKNRHREEGRGGLGERGLVSPKTIISSGAAASAVHESLAVPEPAPISERTSP